jgi:hypothetical protein
MKISYVCLIYKSVEYLKFLHEQFFKFTTLNDGDEFFFVANDATDDVLNYLADNNIKHYIHTNTSEQKKEWYINNVYRAWNVSIMKSVGEYIVFLNSDFAFSEGWAEKLKNKVNNNICVCSRLVERGRNAGGLESGKYGIEKSFGTNPHNYREKDFNNYCNLISKNEINDGGLFMPLMIKKEYLEKVNYYPEGNILYGSDIFNPIYVSSDDVYKYGKKCISGDLVLMEKLKKIGISQYTIFDSIVYHFQQGEMTSNIYDTEFHFYGAKEKNTNTEELFIYKNKNDSSLSIFFFTNVPDNDEWIFICIINAYTINCNCNEYFICKINENMIITKVKPEENTNENVKYIKKVYFKNYIPIMDSFKLLIYVHKNNYYFISLTIN